MDVSALIPARRLTLLVTLAAGLVVLCGLYAALWTPGNLGVTIARGTGSSPVITWVAPDGPAWGAGLTPGDSVVRQVTRGGRVQSLVTRAGQRQTTVGMDSTVPARSDLLAAGLGLVLLVLGAFVRLRGQDRTASAAFWRMSLCAGLALGLIPVGIHGAPWALAGSYIALRLFGPALLELTLVFPEGRVAPLGRFALWAPAVLLVLLYPLSWWKPGALFTPVQTADNVVLGAYILAACLRIIIALRRPRTAQRRAQLQMLALGVLGGFAPLVVLTLLPYALTGRDLVPGDISVLALVLLPLGIGGAIVRAEFLGITSLVHRRELRLLLGTALLGVSIWGVWLVVSLGTRRWGWPAPAAAAGAALIVALAFTPLYRAVTRRAERLFLRDAYDTAGTLLELSVDLSQAAPHQVGSRVVERLGAVLDLGFALLLTPEQQWYHAHPRGVVPAPLRDAVARRAHDLVAAPPASEAFIEQVHGLPVLFLPVRDGQRVLAVLCLGPKRGGDRYTRQDQSLLGALGRHLAVLLYNGHLLARLDEQISALRALAEERAVLNERVLGAGEEERQRLAGVLHDEAIQLGSEVVRQLNDLLALPHLPLDVHVDVADAAGLSADLVTRLRDVAAELYPPPLQAAGLCPALEALARDAERRAGCTCLLDVAPAIQAMRFPPEYEAPLYYIVREAIGNAVRHAHATAIRIALDVQGERLHLTVRDNGDGFAARPIGDLLAEGHMGLALAQQRARDLGGTLEIDTGPGVGATLTMSAPLPLGGRQEVYA